jgi:signal transduction histidine kinase/ActR/RegA family two-component response regulator
LSIRARLLWLMLLAVLLPMAVVLDHFVAQRQATVQADTRRLAGLADGRAQELQDRVRGTLQLLFGLARAPVLGQGDRAACSTFLSEVREAHAQYTGLLTILPDGRLFCDSLRSGRELDLNDRDYFRRALAAPAGVAVLEPVFGRLTGRAVLQVAYPVRPPGGGLSHVLLASLDLAKLLGLGDAQVPGARLLLVDHKGQVLLSTTPGDAGITPGASLAGTALGQFALEGPAGDTTTLTMPDGGRYTWARSAAARTPDPHVRVLAGAPHAALVEAADQRFARDVALHAGVALLLLLAVGWLSERALRQPIARMSAMAERLAAGDLAARLQAPLPRGELGHLMAALNQAADALQTQRADIERLNTRLLQSQRLEAVGQLTGGVAHDFNNLLTVVLGNADLLAESCAGDPLRKPLADMIVEAAQRGAALTQQLLAFARRQPLAPTVADLNQRIASLDTMLRRTLGEHVEIEFVRGGGLWPASVDVAQFDSALLNLCLNARDAMPAGGKLTLETANAALDAHYAAEHPEVLVGQYVMVAISDTGCGIEPALQARVFEPFFTTKEKGKGTGLGLAMVYGFARQSGGHVAIYSEPGHGTTVKLYLPRANPPGALASAGAAAGAEPVADPELRGGHECVLVVEDDDAVRQLACQELRALGYEVLQAASGPEALPLLRGDRRIELLFTDVVMPGGLSGRDLADEARRHRPDLRVLYTSGYTDNAIVHHGRLDAGVQLLAKPYRRADLARAVRLALAAAPC